MSITLNPLNSFERKKPIAVYKNHLPYIDFLFNAALRTNQIDQFNYSPLLKLAFLGNADHYLDRMFVIEEGQIILFLVRNVQFAQEPGEYRRSAYTILRSKTKLIHYDTGIIFSDIFDYAHIEPQETINYISFLYEGKIYTNITEISSIDPTYKLKTKIAININGNELPNDIYYYCCGFQSDIKQKIGYYIPDENLEYYHVIHSFPANFGKVSNQQMFFQNLLSNPNNVYNLLSFVFDDPNLGKPIALTRTGKPKKKIAGNAYNGVSLATQLATETDSQAKKMIIGWFLCEILYPFFFYN